MLQQTIIDVNNYMAKKNKLKNNYLAKEKRCSHLSFTGIFSFFSKRRKESDTMVYTSELPAPREAKAGGPEI